MIHSEKDSKARTEDSAFRNLRAARICEYGCCRTVGNPFSIQNETSDASKGCSLTTMLAPPSWLPHVNRCRGARQMLARRCPPGDRSWPPWVNAKGFRVVPPLHEPGSEREQSRRGFEKRIGRAGRLSPLTEVPDACHARMSIVIAINMPNATCLVGSGHRTVIPAFARQGEFSIPAGLQDSCSGRNRWVLRCTFQLNPNGGNPQFSLLGFT